MPGQGRLGDKANVALDAHGCPACPHPAIGPATQGSPDVNVNRRPALRVDDTGIHGACCGLNTWNATVGSLTVLINGKGAHRIGDQNRHCGGLGQLVEGSPNVIVGESGGGGGASPRAGSGANGGNANASGADGGTSGPASTGGVGDTGGTDGAANSNSSAGRGASERGVRPETTAGTIPINAPITPNTLIVELKLEDGSPAAFRSYSITTPDGQTRSGTLDADGIVRFDDINPGDCQVSFPDLDGREWSPS